jgi:hypothetical protein
MSNLIFEFDLKLEIGNLTLLIFWLKNNSFRVIMPLLL